MSEPFTVPPLEPSVSPRRKQRRRDAQVVDRPRRADRPPSLRTGSWWAVWPGITRSGRTGPATFSRVSVGGMSSYRSRTRSGIACRVLRPRRPTAAHCLMRRSLTASRKTPGGRGHCCALFVLERWRREDWPRGPRGLSLRCRRWRKTPQRHATDPSGRDGLDRLSLGLRVRVVAGVRAKKGLSLWRTVRRGKAVPPSRCESRPAKGRSSRRGLARNIQGLGILKPSDAKRAAVGQALSHLARSGRLMRICRSAYMRPV